MNIAVVLQKKAAEMGAAPALIDVHHGRDRVVTFEQLERLTAHAAMQIFYIGIRKGDGVLILHPVSLELYVVLIALFRIGAVAVFLDPAAGREHVSHCCEIFPPRAFFGSRKAHLLRLYNKAVRGIPLALCPEWLPGTTRISVESSAPTLDEIAPADDQTPALITFTSGSTGQPKAALRTHGFLLAQHRALETSLQLRAGTRDLTTLPVFVLANLASGVTSVLPDADMRSPGSVDPAPIAAQIERNRVTTTAASPAFITRLAQARSGAKPIDTLEHIFMGGAPVFPDDLRRASVAFPRAMISSVYGSTEAEPMAEVSLSETSGADFKRMRSGGGLLTGQPVPSIDLRVIRDQWNTTIPALTEAQFAGMSVPVGEVGEIVVSGEHVLHGYLGAVGDSETKFDVNVSRWHRTGDLGYFDEKRRLWLMGRATAKVSDSRGVLYPFAVECAARGIPEVKRAALVSFENKRLLAVELQNPGLRSTLRENLAWAQLDEIRIVSSIPMDKRHNAKVNYAELMKLLKQK